MKDIFGTPYWLYMAEAEGCDDLVDTTSAKINAIVREFNRLPTYRQNLESVLDLMEEHNLPQTRDNVITVVAEINDRLK